LPRAKLVIPFRRWQIVDLFRRGIKNSDTRRKKIRKESRVKSYRFRPAPQTDEKEIIRRGAEQTKRPVYLKQKRLAISAIGLLDVRRK